MTKKNKCTADSNLKTLLASVAGGWTDADMARDTNPVSAAQMFAEIDAAVTLPASYIAMSAYVNLRREKLNWLPY